VRHGLGSKIEPPPRVELAPVEEAKLPSVLALAEELGIDLAPAFRTDQSGSAGRGLRAGGRGLFQSSAGSVLTSLILRAPVTARVNSTVVLRVVD
jgi:hypothetical protein